MLHDSVRLLNPSFVDVIQLTTYAVTHVILSSCYIWSNHNFTCIFYSLKRENLHLGYIRRAIISYHIDQYIRPQKQWLFPLWKYIDYEEPFSGLRRIAGMVSLKSLVASLKEMTLLVYIEKYRYF